MKKLVSLVLSLLLVLGCFSMGAISVFAEGDGWDGTTAIAPEGAGTEKDPYQIASAENLMWIAKTVTTSAGKYYQQTADIDCNGKDMPLIGSYCPNPDNAGGADGADPTTLVAFSGTYDGNGYKISNGTINGTETGAKYGVALFGVIYGATIKNVTLDTVSLGTVVSQNTALLVGIAMGSYDGDQDCFNRITDCTILNTCKAEHGSPVTGAGNIGSVAAVVRDTEISGCVNHAKVQGNDFQDVGGLMGKTFSNVQIINCTNAGQVGTTNGSGCYTGGIVSRIFGNGTVISGTTNVGTINTASWAGGFACIVNAGTLTVRNCINEGAISGARRVAGFFAQTMVPTTIENCVNSGTITAVSNAAGFVAYVSSTTTIKNCANKGTVTASTYNSADGAAGIVGYSESSAIIQYCYNTGSITGDVYSGGIAGYIKGADSKIENCVNTGSVDPISSWKHVGGILGVAKTPITLTNNINTGNIGFSNKMTAFAGGIAGYAEAAIVFDGCANIGNTISADGCCSASILGSSDEKISHTFINCIAGGTLDSTAGTSGLSALLGYVKVNNASADGAKPVVRDNVIAVSYAEGVDYRIAFYLFNAASQADFALETITANFSGNKIYGTYDCAMVDRNGDLGAGSTRYALDEAFLTATGTTVLESYDVNAVVNAKKDKIVNAVDNALNAVTCCGAQISADKTAIRLVFGVDSLDYAKMSFTMSVGETSITQDTTTVYSSVKGYKEDGTVITYAATDFAEAYLTTVTINGLPAAGTTTFTVTPAAVKADDTAVKGFSVTITVTNGEIVSTVLAANA